jgi:O-antigen/teichoic acid export membrane protein
MSRLISTLFLLGLRAGGLLSKFLLTLFIAREMTLADLGFYGLIAVGATLVPALFGLGLNGPVGRALVDLNTTAAVRLSTTRVGVTLVLHLLLTPLVVAVLAFALPAAQLPLVVLVAVTLFLENLGSDLNAILLSRFRAKSAALFLFIRSGAWPLVFIAVAWFEPAYRTIPAMMTFWLASLLLIGLIVAVMILVQGYAGAMGFDRAQARDMIAKARHFYLADLGNNGALYLDRFLVTTFLGLEATGIYTFFWALTNAVNNVILFGVTSPKAPAIIAAVNQGDKGAIRQACKALLKEIWLWCLGLSVLLMVAMPALLAQLGNDKFDQHKAVFLIMLLATVLRTVSEGTGNILYAHHQDARIARISLVAMGLSAVLILALAPSFALPGVAIAMLLAAVFVYAWRQRISGALLA